MCNKAKAIVLGGTVPHIELIKQLQGRGYYVILVDYLENPVAKPFADEHIIESTLDKDAVLAIAIQNDVELVIATCIDQANATACYVLEKLNKPYPYSYQIALDVTVKSLMKQKMRDNNIPTSNFIIYDYNDTLSEIDLKFPLVSKPVDANSSKGVMMANDLAELQRNILIAFKCSERKQIVVEEFVSGNEIQIDCYVDSKGETKILMTRQKRRLKSQDGVELQSNGSCIPACVSSKVADQLPLIASKIAEAFQLRRTPFFIQAICDDENIKVLEFAPRIGGGTSFLNIKEFAGIDIISAAIDSYLGKEHPIIIKNNKYVYATNMLYVYSATFDRLVGFEEMLAQNMIVDFCISKTSGSFISDNMSSTNRVATFTVKALSYDELKNKVKYVLGNIEAYDIDGNKILRKDIIEKSYNY
ncbi:MAG: ATP-grasp domain-containing protein [bacterium]